MKEYSSFEKSTELIHFLNSMIMTNKKFSFFLLATLIVFSCTNAKNNEVTVDENISEFIRPELAEGFQLVQNNCFSCHNANPSAENVAAPSMSEIKKHYVDKSVSQEQFTKDLISFMNNPNEENSKMPEAIKRYNIMPKMNFSDEQITAIASYVYNSELEKDSWFEKRYEKEKSRYSSITTQLSPIETGQGIAMNAKGVLGKNLLEAINAKGTEHALSFCSTRAIALTDSVALSLNAQIKRVSDKNRNPDNQANETELAYINNTKLALSKGEKPKPQMSEVGNKQIGYYPIITNQMCLQCHGKPKTDVSPATLSKIKSLYPNDKATGYALDELRGIWVIEMDKK